MKTKQCYPFKTLLIFSWILLLSGVVFLPRSSLAALQFTGMAPQSGAVGTRVTLSGSGFDLARSYGVRINETVCSGISVTISSISFTIPAGARSGNVSVSEGGGTPVPYLFPFTVTRVINGTWQSPPGIARAGYYAGSLFSEMAQATDGSFTVTVPDKGVTVIGAARTDEDPAFLAVITSADSSVTLNAASTAKALIFFSPYVATQDEALAQSILSAIGGLPETAGLATLIQNKSADGTDYLENLEVESALVSGIEAYLANPIRSGQAFRSQQAFESSPKGTAFKYLNPEEFNFERQLTGVINPPADDSPDLYTFKLSAAEGNPLEWSTVLYRLNPRKFPNGLTSIDQMPWWDPAERLSDMPVADTYLHSKLKSRWVDLVGVITGYVAKEMVMTEEGRLEIPVDRPDVYMAHSFSGNVFNGTSFVEGGLVSAEPRQENFINNLSGGREQWRMALYANLTIIALDMISVAVPIDTLLEKHELPKLVYSVLQEIMKSTAVIYRPGEPIPKSVWIEALKASVKTVVKTITKKGVTAVLKGIGKTLLKSLDILGKVSKGEQAAERTAGLFDMDVLAVESAVIVVGCPFEPVIRTFSPRRGYHGSKVRIEGYNFDPRKDEITGKYKTRVKFGSQSTDPEAPPEFEADVIHATEKALLVKVPVGAKTSTIWVYTDTGFTSTWLLDRPYSTFEVIDPFTEVILTVQPNPVIQGGIITIVGSHFPAGAGFLTPMNSSDGGTAPIAERGAPYEGPKVIFDGNESSAADIQNMTETEIVVRAPGTGAHAVQVRQGNSLTQGASFVVKGRQELSGRPSGATIKVTSILEGNNPDDPNITLREAFMMAAGLRLPRLHDACESLPESDPNYCGWQPREVDDVSSASAIGAGYADTISLHTSLMALNAPTVTLTGPLPLPEPGDSFEFSTTDASNLVIDGSGLSGVDAWPLNGISYTSLRHVTFRSFPGHGIYLGGGATGNQTSGVRVENCGGTGVFFDQNAANNTLEETKVTGSGIHGLHMSGTDVKYNDVWMFSGSSYSNNAEYGVLIEEGASYNLVCPGVVANNPLEGIMVRGESTDFNVIGRNSLLVPQNISEIYNNGTGNGGAGIHLGPGVDHTLIRYVNVAGNAGDGILLDGPGCAYNQIQSVMTGVDLSIAAKSPNGANGIHLKDGAEHNLIGGRLGGMFGWRNAIGGNVGNGILIEGATSAYNTINQSHVGSVQPGRWYQNPFFGNGQHGIVLRGGTHHNIIGDRHQWLDNHIVAHTQGAGILIEGEGTDKNLIAGNQIGVEHTPDPLYPEPPEVLPLRSNKIGVHLKDGPRGNIIGQMGDPVPQFEYFENPQAPPPFPSEAYYEGIFAFLSGNAISNNTEAGIVIENCGGELGLKGRLEGANVIINNYIGCTEPDNMGAIYDAPNRVGVKLVGGARCNIIGGHLDGQGNQILYNHIAGIEIDSCQITDPKLASRFSNNVIKDTGSQYGQAAWTGSHLDQYEFGIGVLEHGNSANTMVGDASSLENVISNNFVGVYLDSSNGTRVHNNLIHDNVMAGVVARNSTGCEIGGNDANQGNAIWSNGTGGAFEGGIILSGGNTNKVECNFVGLDDKAQPDKGNNGWGVIARDSSGNTIGSPGVRSGNVVVNNAIGGILLTGSNARDNKVQGNYVGVERRGRPNFGNKGPGVQLDTGAADNLIGGEGQVILGGGGTEGTVERGAGTVLKFPAPNTIANNLEAGVLVDGAGTLRNTILYNSISNNGGEGIELANGSNANIIPPAIQGYDGFEVYGTVELAKAPAGSTVQVFSDPGGEGAQYLGETTVLAGGAWSAPVANPVFAMITATVTDLAGNTSEFGGFSLDSGGLLVSRTDGGTGSESGGINVLKGAVILDFRLTAVNTDVLVGEIRFEAQGTLNDVTQILAARLYHDRDESGTVTEWDDLIGGGDGVTFDANNGSLRLRVDNGFLAKARPERWLLALDFADDVPLGLSFQTKIPSPDAISAEAVYPFSIPGPSGNFPIQSDQYETRPGLEYVIRILRMLCRETSQEVSGITDKNGDGRVGLEEAIFILQNISGLRQ